MVLDKTSFISLKHASYFCLICICICAKQCVYLCTIVEHGAAGYNWLYVSHTAQTPRPTLLLLCHCLGETGCHHHQYYNINIDFNIIITTTITFLIFIRPRPALGRLGLTGLSGGYTFRVVSIPPQMTREQKRY